MANRESYIYRNKKALSEVKTMHTMIGLYCKGVHKNDIASGKHNVGDAMSDERQNALSKNTLCPDCQELFEYALTRIEACPFKDEKSFCSSCTVHCYKQDRQEDIRRVMRYSGPRMIFHNPVMAIRHALSTRKAGS